MKSSSYSDNEGCWYPITLLIVGLVIWGGSAFIPGCTQAMYQGEVTGVVSKKWPVPHG